MCRATMPADHAIIDHATAQLTPPAPKPTPSHSFQQKNHHKGDRHLVSHFASPPTNRKGSNHEKYCHQRLQPQHARYFRSRASMAADNRLIASDSPGSGRRTGFGRGRGSSSSTTRQISSTKYSGGLRQTTASCQQPGRSLPCLAWRISTPSRSSCHPCRRVHQRRRDALPPQPDARSARRHHHRRARATPTLERGNVFESSLASNHQRRCQQQPVTGVSTFIGWHTAITEVTQRLRRAHVKHPSGDYPVPSTIPETCFRNSYLPHGSKTLAAAQTCCKNVDQSSSSPQHRKQTAGLGHLHFRTVRHGAAGAQSPAVFNAFTCGDNRPLAKDRQRK